MIYADVSPYPNSVLSAGELMIIAFVMVAVLAFWLISVYIAAREPRHAGTGTARPAGPLPGDTQAPGAADTESADGEPAAAAGATTGQ